MTLVSLKKGYVVTIVTSENAITGTFTGNKGAEATEKKSADNKTFTYTLKDDGDLNVMVAGSKYIYSIKIVQPEVSSETTSYTINYVDMNGNVLKSISHTDEPVGSNVNATEAELASFYNEDGTKKYVYSEGNDGIVLEKESSSNVITLKFNTYTQKQYKLVAKYDGKELSTISEGNYFNDGSTKVSYSKYVKVADKWYATEAPYCITITEDEPEVTYSDAADVDYFMECENMHKSRSAAASSSDDNLSNGVAPRHYFNSYWYTDEIENGGVYKLTIPYTRSSNTNSTISIQTRDAEGNLYDTQLTIASDASRGTLAVEDVYIPASRSLVLYNTGNYNSNIYMDYIVLKKTGDVLPLSTEYALSTYAPATDVDLTNKAGVKFYAAKVNGASVTLTEVTGKVKAGTGLLVENAEKAESVTLACATDGAEVVANDLKGATEDMTAAELVADNAYILVSDTQFQKVGNSTTGSLAKGKAYLSVNNVSAARLLTIDNPTGINGVTEKADAQGADVIYNVQGMRVEKADANGLYIINGKKYIKK